MYNFNYNPKKVVECENFVVVGDHHTMEFRLKKEDWKKLHEGEAVPFWIYSSVKGGWKWKNSHKCQFIEQVEDCFYSRGKVNGKIKMSFCGPDGIWGTWTEYDCFRVSFLES